jgi:hypothetical protein
VIYVVPKPRQTYVVIHQIEFRFTRTVRLFKDLGITAERAELTRWLVLTETDMTVIDDDYPNLLIVTKNDKLQYFMALSDKEVRTKYV